MCIRDSFQLGSRRNIRPVKNGLKTGHQCGFMNQCKCQSLTQGTSVAFWISTSGYLSHRTPAQLYGAVQVAISHREHQCSFMDQCKWLSLTQGTSVALWTSASGYPSHRASGQLYRPVQVAIPHTGHQCSFTDQCKWLSLTQGTSAAL